ncbi:hypothetical protein [Paracoccus sp. TOH]|uniref:hypothetical protein n=1 Tax=Paracoccus sp. TOH TaxID=1263728 RepID=UPI0025B22465|nr:hypothetical protein [Paracoccus sp. TOH]WJS84907.1 hypothetical protein NBE95_03755 [Paracoccus sp. TOH]
MQHDMMRHPPPPPTENVGDVLASIRRLIAQDDGGCRIPDQTLNALPVRESPRIEPVLTARRAPPQNTPLILDSSDLVDAPVQAGPHPEALAPPAPAVPAEPAPHPFGDWLIMPLDGQADSAPAQPGGTTPDPDPGADLAPIQIQPFGPFLQEPAPTNAQMEETMLHANASVTPINPLAEAHAAAEALSRETEPHLFAPQEKGAQKGTHLRGMIREAIRQELQGEIGTRLSRNLQQMIRHEIELALRQMCEQD